MSHRGTVTRVKPLPLPENPKTWRRVAVVLGLFLLLLTLVGLVYVPYFFAGLPSDLFSTT